MPTELSCLKSGLHASRILSGTVSEFSGLGGALGFHGELRGRAQPGKAWTSLCRAADR